MIERRRKQKQKQKQNSDEKYLTVHSVNHTQPGLYIFYLFTQRLYRLSVSHVTKTPPTAPLLSDFFVCLDMIVSGICNTLSMEWKGPFPAL